MMRTKAEKINITKRVEHVSISRNKARVDFPIVGNVFFPNHNSLYPDCMPFNEGYG